MWTICIFPNNFFQAAWTSVMSYFVFSDHDRLRLGNFLNNLRLDPKRSAKLCTAIWTSICFNFYLTIWHGTRSSYSFMPHLLTRISLVVISFFRLRPRLRLGGVWAFSYWASRASSSLIFALSNSFSRLNSSFCSRSCLLVSPSSMLPIKEYCYYIT